MLYCDIIVVDFRFIWVLMGFYNVICGIKCVMWYDGGNYNNNSILLFIVYSKFSLIMVY